MALRAGMINLINHVRRLTSANTAEYTVDGIAYWADSHLQDVLDEHADYLIDYPLQWQASINTSGVPAYKIAQSAYGYLEGLSSGTARFYINTAAGSVVGTANYSVDYSQGRVSFTSDQGGTAYYLSGYSYDVYGAAADVWQQRLANFSDWYDFQADNQTFTRSQAFDHAQAMLRLMEQKQGSNVLQNQGDLKTGQFVRTDINANY